MTQIVQIAGYEADVENIYVGPIRELRAEISNFSLRLHDGVRPGGFVFLNRDDNDARYQAKNEELDQFKFPAQDKGFIVRVSPGVYRVRRVVSASGDITFVNPRGTLGDIDIRISDEVETDHTWSGVNTYTKRIVAQNGLEGDTFGLHTGNVVGNVTGNLTGNANGDHTGSFTGDLDTEGHALNMGDESIELAWIKGFGAALAASGVYPGSIVLWYGSADSVPIGWFICNGSNGTPDLRDRFVLGAGPIHSAGATGGSAEIGISGNTGEGGAHTHALDIEGHALTLAEIPAHKHGNGVTDSGTDLFNHGTFPANPNTPDSIDNNSNNGTIEGYTTTEGGGNAHSHTGVATSSGAHTHPLSAEGVEIMPPYKALHYIMKGIT